MGDLQDPKMELLYQLYHILGDILLGYPHRHRPTIYLVGGFNPSEKY